MSQLKRVWFLDTTGTEIWLSLISVLSGLWLLMPFTTISVPFSMLPGLESGFAVWLLLLGAFRLYVVFFNHERWRMRCAVAAFSTWLFLLYLSLMVDFRALVTVMYFASACMSTWVYLRSPSSLKTKIGGARGRILENSGGRARHHPHGANH